MRTFGVRNQYNYKCRVAYDNGEVAEKEGMVRMNTDLVGLNVASPVANGAYVGEMNLIVNSENKNLDSVWFVNPLTGANETYNGAKTMGLPTGTYNITIFANNTLGVVSMKVIGFRIVPADHSVYFYGPFGVLLENTEGAERFKWIGKEIDTATGLYLIGAREYEADTGAFIQPDVMVSNVYDPLAWNRYTYGRGNPYRYVDRDGKMAVKGGVGKSMNLGFGVIGAKIMAVFAYDTKSKNKNFFQRIDVGVEIKAIKVANKITYSPLSLQLPFDIKGDYDKNAQKVSDNSGIKDIKESYSSGGKILGQKEVSIGQTTLIGPRLPQLGFNLLGNSGLGFVITKTSSQNVETQGDPSESYSLDYGITIGYSDTFGQSISKSIGIRDFFDSDNEKFKYLYTA